MHLANKVILIIITKPNREISEKRDRAGIDTGRLGSNSNSIRTNNIMVEQTDIKVHQLYRRSIDKTEIVHIDIYFLDGLNVICHFSVC